MEPTEEELKELERLNSITDALWKKGKETNWSSMTHTKANADRTDLYIRSRNIADFMNMQVSMSKKKQVSLKIINFNKKNNSFQNIGMIF